MTLGQYIKIMDALWGIELRDDMTATDLFNSHPEKVIEILEATTETKDIKDLSPTMIIGMLDVVLSRLAPPEPYPVPFIEVGGKTYTACDPLLMNMAGDKIEYGTMTFGNCLEAFTLLDNSTRPHQAMPMVLAYLFEGEGHPMERAKLFLDMDYWDAYSAHFFFASLGIGYTLNLLSQQQATIEA